MNSMGGETCKARVLKLWRRSKLSDEINSILIHVLSFNLITELTTKHQNWAQKEAKTQSGLAWKSGKAAIHHILLLLHWTVISLPIAGKPIALVKTKLLQSMEPPKLFLCISNLSMMKACLRVIYLLSLFQYHSSSHPVWGSLQIKRRFMCSAFTQFLNQWTLVYFKY